MTFEPGVTGNIPPLAWWVRIHGADMTHPLPIAAWLTSYDADVKSALRFAATDGFTYVHADATAGTLSPYELFATGRRHLSRYLRDLGLNLAGFSAEFPGAGLADPASADQRLAHVRALAEMAHELRVPLVSVKLTGLGSADSPVAGLSSDLLAPLADIADRTHVRVAVHSPNAEPIAAARSVRRLGTDALALALDTADIPAAGLDAASAAAVGDVWLRDIRRTRNGAEQVAYGGGEVNFPGVLAVLAQSEYRGPLVLRCDVGAQGGLLLRQGRQYIDRLMNSR